MKAKCEVCGRSIDENDCILVPGRYGSYSFGSCTDCLCKGIEPYSWITYPGGYAQIAIKKYPNYLPRYEVENIRKILAFYGKNDEDFLRDCKKTLCKDT